MKKKIGLLVNFLLRLALLTLCLLLVIGFIYVFQWAKGNLIASNLGGSNAGAYPYPPPENKISTSIILTPIPSPSDTFPIPKTQYPELPQPTLIPIPPPGWPTQIGWPPDEKMISPYPTIITQFFPTLPANNFNELKDFPENLYIGFPYYRDTAHIPQLWAANIDPKSQKLILRPLGVDVEIPVPLSGPDPGPVLMDFHLSPNSQWLVADYAYRGSQLYDFETGRTKELSRDLPSSYWHFMSWGSDHPVTLLAAGPEIPVEIVKLINVEKGLVEQEYFLKKGATDNGNLDSAGISSKGEIAIAIIRPPVIGLRENWSASVCLQSCTARKLIELDGGVDFVDRSLQWSSLGDYLIWGIVVMGINKEFETQLWIADIETGYAKMLTVIGENVKNTFPPAWSEDALTIAILRTKINQANQQEEQNIFLINVETGQETPLTAFRNIRLSHLHWLPGNQWLAYTVDRGGFGEIWATKIDGTQTIPIAGPTLPNTPYFFFTND